MRFHAELASFFFVAFTACGPRAPTRTARPASQATMVRAPQAAICADDIPAELSADTERNTQLAKTCDAAARCELACLRARCAAGRDCTDACVAIERRARRTGRNQVDALNAATAGCERRDPDFCVDLRQRSLEDATSPRRLANLFQAESAPVAETDCAMAEPRTAITEISIERTVCFGSCPIDSLSLYANGSVEYFGEAYVEHLGRRLGHIDLKAFDRLARIIEDLGFFRLQSSYSCMVTDNPTVYTSVVRAGVRKTIQHYAPGMTGPTRLQVLDDIVAEQADYVNWSD